ncbi:titin homolog [Condylostylus longicornis]|uniref:titin homolog n=1 Tax=Condylostylus longicornis TaxID=2530218 RepID=UPI00244DFFED|nr:titin homolog [Condylostylus longicornis]
MVRRIKDFIRYTAAELENYTKSKNSCVKKINKRLHLNFPPYGLTSFKATLLKLISEKKIGSYDTDLDGIILDIRNIKVLGDIGAIRFDDSFIHINIQADCYVFQPKVGSVVQGLVKHISQRQIGVIIYRVFSVPIRLSDTVNKSSIALNSEIEFRIKNFDLQNTMPYIEGELMAKEVSIKKAKNSIKFADDDSNEEIEDNENSLFKKPNQKKVKKEKKSACEILADSENEEIVFSELSYLNEEEARKLKEPKKRKKLNSESFSSDITAKQNNSPKHDSKKTVRFEDASNSSSSESDGKNITSSNILKQKESQNIKSDHYEKDEADVVNSKLVSGEQKKHNKTSDSSSESDNEYSYKDNKNTQNKIQNIEKPVTKINGIGTAYTSSSDVEGDKNNVLNEIKSVKEDSADLVPNTEKKPLINLDDSTDSDNQNEFPLHTISHKEHIAHTSIKREYESDDEKFIQSIYQESNDKTNSFKIESTTPVKKNQQVKSEIKTEVETPIKMNGYESEDLFNEHLENSIPSNQNVNTVSKRKKERKISLTQEMNAVLANTILQRKIVELSPAYSTQKEIPERSDKSSVKSASDTSFNEAFKEILEKSKRKKLSESESSNFGLEISVTKTNLLNDVSKSTKKNKLQKKEKKNSLENSMAEILKSSMENKLKEMKSSQELCSPLIIQANNDKNTKEISKKKSRKRKISLNESINDVLTKMIKEKSNKNTFGSPSKKIKVDSL